MIRLNPNELVQLFRRPGGEDFTSFVNELIESICGEEGILQSEISTCLRTDAPDGGVDTRVGRGGPGDRTGYFGTPSIWQFRAVDKASVSAADLRREVNKSHAKACLERGDGYRICFCDQITDKKRNGLQNSLEEAIKVINPNAPTPKILDVGDLARLANRYPALVMRLRPSLSKVCRLFDSLRASETALTPKFVPTSSFEPIKTAILRHADLQQSVPEAVLPIQGVAGVGKTRTVYESLCFFPQARTLVLYTDDEEGAVELATYLSNDENARAILLADECSVSWRQRLNNNLRGCRNRIRAISIDNSGELMRSAAPELALTKLSLEEVEKVLRANFSTIPADRLRSYAHLSGGFIKLAADMCNFDPQIAAVGSVGPVMANINEYYRNRLTPDQREAVEAVALLKRVGHKDEAGAQLDALCSLTGLRRGSIERDLGSVKDVPGFVERGARYYRVTPDIIAMVAFEGAWKRWADGQEDSFLSRISETIQESFLQRVSESANQEVRNTVQGFFRRFADNFTTGDLGDISLVNRIINLIEVEPTIYLPAFRRVIESASHEQLITSPESGGGRWGPRRQLVWLAERFAQFPEFFEDAEAILFKLSVHECEHSIGNNATKTWQQLFRFQLSGTALPLSVRLAKLRNRIAAVDGSSAES